MAYMNQEHKARIRTNLKKVIPNTWKWSLGVRHHSTIVLNIRSAPLDVLEHIRRVDADKRGPDPLQKSQIGDHYQVNEYYLDRQFDGTLLDVMRRIKAVLNLDNHDRSDIQRDHFDVGHYIDINFGKWDKPFEIAA